MHWALRKAIEAADPHTPRCFERLSVHSVDRREFDRMVCEVCGRFYGYRPFWLRDGYSGRVLDSASETSTSARRRRRASRLRK